MTSTDFLLGALLWIGASAAGFVLCTWLLVELPATYFLSDHPREWWIDRHPIVRWVGRVLKNGLGAVLVVLGVVLSLPGVPGPGILTIVIGVTLLEFPGKRRLELWMIRRPVIRQGIDRIRRHYGKPPLELSETGPEVERTSIGGSP